MTDRLGDAPIEARLRDQMNKLARFIDEQFNKKDMKNKQWGFCFMVFPFEGFDGRCNYISNASRKDILTLLKEQIKRFEGQPDLTGHG